MFRYLSLAAGSLSLVATPAAAATLKATSATFKSVFASAKAGDTIVMSGSFGRLAIADRSFATTVTLDARKATFTNTFSLSKITGVKILGGKYGSSTKAAPVGLGIYGGSNITVSGATFVGNGGKSHGLDVNGTRNITVSSSTFTGLYLGVGLIGVTGGKLLSNKSIRASSDGFNVADSHNVLVSKNSCSGTKITAGAHPDCVQLWSVAGHTPQSDIEISDNVATGATQGFTSFNGSAGGGDRLLILRNRVDTSYPQGIACYGCRNSVISGNVLTTLPGSKYRTSMNIVGGADNTVSGNTINGVKSSGTSMIEVPEDGAIAAFEVKAEAMRSFTDVAALKLQPGDALASDGLVQLDTDLDATGAVPEPGVWLMLIGGFGLVGAAARRRRTAVAA